MNKEYKVTYTIIVLKMKNPSQLEHHLEAEISKGCDHKVNSLIHINGNNEIVIRY